MHRTDLGSGYAAFHNGDFTGDVEIFSREDEADEAPWPLLYPTGVSLPASCFVALVAAMVRAHRVSEAANASAESLLGLPERKVK